MSSEPGDWMTAAACAQAPQPSVTFADLPPEHRGEIRRYACVAAASTAYFVALAVVTQPLPSRSLASHAALPRPGTVRPAALDARLAPPGRSAAPSRARAARHVEIASLRSPRARVPQRRSLFSRLFLGMLRSIQPVASKAAG